jgi:inorganic pyrophosphatase/exopolyphosphatase
MHLLDDCKIPFEDLYFMDEFRKHYSADLVEETILFDHNLLDMMQSDLGKNVTNIVDHHTDTRSYSNTVNPKNRVIKLMGSACSLLALMIMND